MAEKGAVVPVGLLEVRGSFGNAHDRFLTFGGGDRLRF
jgi:hypothetical protein